jgi:hypothetical protein
MAGYLRIRDQEFVDGPAPQNRNVPRTVPGRSRRGTIMHAQIPNYHSPRTTKLYDLTNDAIRILI